MAPLPPKNLDNCKMKTCCSSLHPWVDRSTKQLGWPDTKTNIPHLLYCPPRPIKSCLECIQPIRHYPLESWGQSPGDKHNDVIYLRFSQSPLDLNLSRIKDETKQTCKPVHTLQEYGLGLNLGETSRTGTWPAQTTAATGTWTCFLLSKR